MPKRAKAIIRIAIQFVIILIVTEVITRVVFSDFSDDRYFLNQSAALLFNSGVVFGPEKDNYHEKFGYQLSPNSEKTIEKSEFTYVARTNSLGFREKEIVNKDSSEYRSLFIGDSMFWGVGVDEKNTVAALVEETCRNNGMDSFVSLNYAISGYNTVQEYLVAEAYLDTLNADHLIVGFFVANDFLPNAVAYIDSNGNYGSDLSMRDKIQKLYKAEMGIFFHSVFCRIMAMKVFIPRARYKIAANPEIIQKTYDLMDRLKVLANQHNVNLSVVVLYPRDAVQGGIVQRWSQSRKPGNMVVEYCRKQGIEVLDLLDYMNTPEQKEKYFFPEDGHPNQAGNAFIAKQIWNDIFSKHQELN